MPPASYRQPMPAEAIHEDLSVSTVRGFIDKFVKQATVFSIVCFQIGSAQSAKDIVEHIDGPKKNAELMIEYARKQADKLLWNFVDAKNRKRILTEAEFGTVGAIRACYQMAVIIDDMLFVVSRAESEADQSQSVEAQTVKSLKVASDEISKIGYTFCGFDNETNVPVGKPSDSLVVRLVKLRNTLRRASDVTFSLRDTSTQNTPRYWADLGLKSMGIVRAHVANPDGTPRTQFKDAVLHMKIGYHLAHSMIIVTAIQLTRNQVNKAAGRDDDLVCKEMISDLSDLITEPGQAYAYGTGNAPGVMQGHLSPALTQAVDVAIKAMHAVRARCASE